MASFSSNHGARDIVIGDATVASTALSSVTGFTFNKATMIETNEVSRSQLHEKDENFGFAHRKIYGRERETKILQEAFDRVRALDGAQEIVVVTGSSGQGKSTLVDSSLRNFASDEGGHFVSGKFDQMQRSGDSFTAISDALSDLCDLLLSTNTEQEATQLQKDLKEVLGSQAKALIALVPNLRFLLQDLNASDTLGDSVTDFGEKAFALLVQLCAGFLSVVVSATRPLVIFLDDIQWADEASVELLKSLVDNRTLNHILIVLTVRLSDSASSEADDSEAFDHPCIKWLAESNVAEYTLIHLRGLGVRAIQGMIGAMMKSSIDSSGTKELSSVAFQKTHGNPFFIEQFLDSLQRSDLLVGTEEGNWYWDIDKIKGETDVSDNVLSLVASKIGSLSEDTQEVLKLAAFLGHRFSADVLESIVLEGPDETRGRTVINLNAGRNRLGIWRALEKAAQHGLLEHSGHHQFKFCHDRIQQSLIAMIGEDEQVIAKFHLSLGRVLKQLSQRGTCDLREEENLLLMATDHLNLGSVLIDQNDEILSLVSANFAASTSCFQHFSFQPSSKYLRYALNLLDRAADGKKWSVHHQLTLELTGMLANVEFCRGRFEVSTSLCTEILEEANTPNEKLDAFTTLIKCLGFEESRMGDAVKLGLRVCGMLGEVLPKKGSLLSILLEFFKARRSLRKLSDHDMMSLPHMTEANKELAVDVMMNTSFHCLLDEDSLPFYGILTMRLMSLTCEHGATTWTPAILAQYGQIEAALGNLKVAHRLFKLTVALMEQSDSPKVKNRCILTLHSSLSQWFQTYAEALVGFREAYLLGLECGDVDSGLCCGMLYTHVGIHHGLRLRTVENDARILCRQMRDFSLQSILNLALPSWQLMINLIGEDVDDPKQLQGEAMNDLCDVGTNKVITFVLLHTKLILADLFDDWVLCEELLVDHVKLREALLRGSFSNFYSCFLEGHVGYRLFERTRKSLHLRVARRATKRLALWAKQGVENCEATSFFLRAQSIAAIDKKAVKKTEFLVLINQALSKANEMSLMFLLGQINERACHILKKVYDDRISAAEYFQSAVEKYEDWEAFSKVKWLNEYQISE